MRCKGVCESYRALKNSSGARYADGQKRCQGCEIFIKWDGIFCPCCGRRLRLKPRNKIYKEKLRSMKLLKNIRILPEKELRKKNEL